MHKPLLRITLLIGAFIATACVESLPITSADGPATPQFTVAAAASADDVIPGQYLVMFKKNEIPTAFAADVAARGGTIQAAHGKVGIAVVSGLDDAGATALASRSDVEVVSPDVVFSVDPVPDLSVEALPDVVASPAAPNTAFFFARQWHMRRIGANVAWAAGKLGAANVTVAILDTGIGYTHPDLAGRVDLSRSASFVPSDDALVAFFFPGAHPIADLHYHGTHVAATVASNAVAAAGVTSRTTLIGVKVCNVNGQCPSSAVLAGVLFATDHGADVMNLSLGGSFDPKSSKAAKDFAKLIDRTFKYAYHNGTLAVVAAGNEATDLDANGSIYKTYCDSPNVVCVSATGPTSSGGTNGPWFNEDASAFYTNFGKAINVAAPGGTSAGLVWEACSQFSLQIPICRTGTFVVGIGGTSMATPHVSGLAALVTADLRKKPQQVRQRILKTADDLGEPGSDPFYGKGRINVARAIGLIN